MKEIMFYAFKARLSNYSLKVQWFTEMTKGHNPLKGHEIEKKMKT